MSRAVGIVGVGVVLAFVMLFSRWNGAERVTLDLGVRTFDQIPLLYVSFISLLLGMVVMLLAGLHSDLKIRRFLRDRFEEEGRDEGEYPDRHQRDLFLDDEDIPSFESVSRPAPGELDYPDWGDRPDPRPSDPETGPADRDVRSSDVPQPDDPTSGFVPDSPGSAAIPIPDDDRPRRRTPTDRDDESGPSPP